MNTHNNNIPALRFREFSGEWEETTLENVSEFSNERVSCSLLSCENYVTTENMLPGIQGVIPATSVPQNVNVIQYKKGDILFSNIRPYLKKVWQADKDGGSSADVNVIKALSNCSPDFLLYIIANDKFIDYVMSGAKGVKMPRGDKRQMAAYDLSVPSLAEQQELGNYFRVLDVLLLKSSCRVEKLKQVKAACLQNMFPKKGHNIPNLRFKGFSLPWEEVRISDNAVFSKGHGYSKADIRDEGTPLLLYGSLYTNYKTNIIETSAFAIPQNGSVKSTGKEVIVPASGETAEDIARASAVKQKGIILGGDLNIITPNETIDTTFLALELTYGGSHYQLVKKAQGASVVHLHNSEIKDLSILVPSLAEQQKIGDFFSTLDAKISLASARVEKLKQIKAACLRRMFP